MKRLTVATLLVVLPSVAQAAIYRWVDRDGRLHFSERPPIGVKFELMPETMQPGTSPHVDSLRELGATREAERSEAGKEDAKKKQAQSQAEERCAKARERLVYLEQRPPNRIASTGPDGEVYRLTEEEYEGRRARAQKDIADNCN